MRVTKTAASASQAGGGSQCECRAAGLDALHRQAGYRECDRAYDEMRADDSRIGRRERAGCELVVRDGGKALLVQCEHDGPRHERERRQYDESALERARPHLRQLQEQEPQHRAMPATLPTRGSPA